MTTRDRVEVLLVLVGLVLCGSLLTLSVLGARDRRQRLQCHEHLRILGLGLQHYHSEEGAFPPGTQPSAQWPVNRRFSWLASVLPRIESEPFLDFTPPWDADEKRWPKVRVALYVCPADRDAGARGAVGVTHYVGLAGVGPEAATLPVGDPHAGFFGYDRRISARDVRDGLSETVAVVETAASPGPWAAGGPATVRPLDPAGPPYLGYQGQFGGWHLRSVTNVLFGDGSVRPLGARMSPSVLQALATIAGDKQEVLWDE